MHNFLMLWCVWIVVSVYSTMAGSVENVDGAGHFAQ